MSEPRSRRALMAVDPRTYRRQHLGLSAAWDEHTEPEVLGSYIADVVVTLARRWRERYSVTMPMKRIEWSIEELNE